MTFGSSIRAQQRAGWLGLIAGLAMLPGCMVPKPFGYYQVWSDSNTYGEPSLYFERVRTDSPAQPRQVVSSTESVSQSRPTPATPEAIADASVPGGVWLFRN